MAVEGFLHSLFLKHGPVRKQKSVYMKTTKMLHAMGPTTRISERTKNLFLKRSLTYLQIEIESQEQMSR